MSMNIKFIFKITSPIDLRSSRVSQAIHNLVESYYSILLQML